MDLFPSLILKGSIDKIQECINTAGERETTTSQTAKNGNADLYSITTLKNICQGNQGMIVEMLTAFIKQVPATVKDIKSAYQTQDFHSLYIAAHNIKPNIDTLEINSLKENIRQIESYATHKKKNSDLLHLITVLDTTLLKVVDQLKTRELV